MKIAKGKYRRRRNRIVIVLGALGVCLFAAAITVGGIFLARSLTASPAGSASSAAISSDGAAIGVASSGVSSIGADSSGAISSGGAASVAISSEAVSSAVEAIAPTTKPDFSDAAFIGDSRTEALKTYGVLKGATYFCYKGLMVNTAFTEKVIPVDGNKLTVMDALSKKQFKRVYVMLGVNELGWGSAQKFKEDYAKVVQGIKKSQPDAAVYVQSILPVSKKKSDKDKIYNNPQINRFNTIIEEMTVEEGVIYLPANTSVAGEDGALPPDASTDGVHPNIDYCRKWAAYLEENS